MKKTLLFISCLFIVLTQNAQTELWGITNTGGLYNDGTIFKTDGSGDNHIIEYDFFQIKGANPIYSNLIEASNGILYGMTSNGGANFFGVLFQYDIANNTYVKKIEFDGINTGSTPYGSLIKASDGYLYGLTSQGGVNNYGIIFRYDISANTITKLFDFDGSINGYNPRGSLMQAADGCLYGVTAEGGLNGGGVLFKYNIITNTFTKKYDLTIPNGTFPIGSLIQATDGNLYGVTMTGGTNNLGTLFQYNYVTNTYVKKNDFDNTNGYYPSSSLIQALDGKIYGVTLSGGATGGGVLFQYDPSVNSYIKKVDFSSATGNLSSCSLIQAANGQLLGMTSSGGINNIGVLFQYDITSDSIIKKIDFSGSANGANPQSSLMVASDGKFYGMTTNGGLGYGVMFQYDSSTNVLIKLFDFLGSENGCNPAGEFIQTPDGKLYGVTNGGGSKGLGVLYQYDPNTHVYTKKNDFDGSITGKNPNFIIKGIDGKIYGMTPYGGLNDMGVLYQYDPVNSTFSIKHNFSATLQGEYPQGSLLQDTSGIIYGMTYSGGANDYGVIFQFNTITNVYNKLHDFNFIDGAYPSGELIKAMDGKLYGLTSTGGIANFGVIFQYDLSTNTFVKKMDLQGTLTGSSPHGGFIKCTDGKLYCLTFGGGIDDAGTLLQYDIISNSLVKKVDFSYLNGANPQSSLVEATDGKLYGVTSSGGAFNKGVMFQYDPLNDNFNKKLDFNTNNGAFPNYCNLFETQSLVGIRENLLNNNFSLFPNPNNGSFTIELNSKSQITITNILGETILDQPPEIGKQNFSIQLQADGIYFVKVTDDKGLSTTQKIVVQK